MFGWLFGKKKKDDYVPDVKIIPVKKEQPKKKVVRSEKIRYLCNSCGFRFSRGIGVDFNNICPYCGKRSVVVDETADAGKLLESAQQMDDDRFFSNR